MGLILVGEVVRFSIVSVRIMVRNVVVVGVIAVIAYVPVAIVS